MFLKVKNKSDGKELNIMIDQIVSFAPISDDKTQGSTVLTTSGVSFQVDMSTQSIRGRIVKMYGGPVEDQVKS